MKNSSQRVKFPYVTEMGEVKRLVSHAQRFHADWRPGQCVANHWILPQELEQKIWNELSPEKVCSAIFSHYVREEYQNA